MSYKYTWFDRTRRFIFREIPNFFINIYKFRKALWRHHWWDYSGTLHFIEIGVNDIAKNLENKGLEVDHSRMKKVDKMKRLVEILRNKREDRYFDIVEKEMNLNFKVTFENNFDKEKKIKFLSLCKNRKYFLCKFSQFFVL